ncbi:hypothetical protein J6590_033945 [Homalodisca vitripennis]|nr:hypothetical protein J6590_033945 [Homalodisca vitripennis]
MSLRNRQRANVHGSEREMESRSPNKNILHRRLIFSVGLSALIVLVSRGEQSGTARETASLRIVTSSPLATHPPNNLSTMEVWLLRGN